MLEILKYVFSDMWYFIGAIILLYGVGEVIVSIVDAVGNAIAKCVKARKIDIYKEQNND